MNSNELLTLLDLDARPAAQPQNDNSPLVTSSDSAASTTPASSTALIVDAWGLRRGADLLAESERLRKTGIDGNAAADFFTMAFEPDPQLNAACVDSLRHRFITQMLETPEYQSLHISTQLQDTAAAIAATHFAEQFAQLQKEVIPGTREEAPEADEMATLRAVARAVTEADKEVSEFYETTAALGMGLGDPGTNDPQAVAAIYKRVRNNTDLRRICELAGRYRRVAQSKQRRKLSHGLDDIVGVEPGGDIGRLLPVELAKLMIPELELDTLRRIVERQALCREHHAVEPVGKGPIIVAIDESSSMQGDKAHTAKAFALAMAWIARQQRRWCGLVAYSGDSGERLLALPPGRWDETKLADWLIAFIGYGSTIDVPIREMPEYYALLHAPVGITDLIFITDAECHLPVEMQAKFIEWKKSVKARLLTLVIDNPPGDLAAISDDVYSVPMLSADADAVGEALSR